MSKTLNGFETFLLMPAIEINGVPWIVTPNGLVDYEDPGADALNFYQAITKPSDVLASHGGNISCAVEDDINLGLTGSDTDSGKTICSKGNSDTLTLHNFVAEITFRRDGDVFADSLRNLVYNLTRAADVPYFIAHRVRGQKDSTEPAAEGDEWDFYYVHTDVQVPDFGDDNPIKAASSFVPRGVVNVGHTLTH